MNDFDPKAIRDALLARGVALNSPITADALDRLSHWAGGSLDADFVRLLQEFDGFSNDDFDVQSFVSVWPVDKAIAHPWTRHPILAFSDLAWDAIIYGFDPGKGGPVISIEDAHQVAPTYAEFWSLLLAGRL